MILQLFLPNLSGALDAISGRPLNFFCINWVFWGEVLFLISLGFFCLGWGIWILRLCWIGRLDVLSASCTKWGFPWVLPVLLKALSSLLCKTCKDQNCSTIQSNLFCSFTESRQLKVLIDWLFWNFSPNTNSFFYFTDGVFPDRAVEIHYLSCVTVKVVLCTCLGLWDAAFFLLRSMTSIFWYSVHIGIGSSLVEYWSASEMFLYPFSKYFFWCFVLKIGFF